MREPSDASGSPSSQSGHSETEVVLQGAARPEVETVDEGGDGYESEESSKDDGSRASSTFSAPDTTFDLREYVDLTNPGAFCMIKMTRILNG